MTQERKREKKEENKCPPQIRKALTENARKKIVRRKNLGEPECATQKKRVWGREKMAPGNKSDNKEMRKREKNEKK